MADQPRHQYQLLIYQVPSQPSAARVGVWRELKRLGALYLQQSVCIVPNVAPVRQQFEAIAGRIAELGGTYHLLPIRALPPDEDRKIVDAFLAQSTLQYDEIIENCEVNFVKEIEFETYRQNFTYAEAEEIRQDLDKIRRWFDRVVERDWFGSDRKAAAAAWIDRCERLLEEFEEKVFALQQVNGPMLAPATEGDPLAPPLPLKRGPHPRTARRRPRG